VGVVEMRDGGITNWLNYFDLGTYFNAMASVVGGLVARKLTLAGA
jgi:limonene-1,2-epoxide hydrolase